MADQMNTTEAFLLFNSDRAIEVSISVLSQGFCYGAFLALTLMAFYRLGNRPLPRTRPTKMLCWMVLFLWMVFTASVAVDLAGQILMIRWPLTSTSTPNLSLRESKHMIRPITYMVADAVSLWRCYVIWPHSRKARILFVAVCIIDIATSIGTSILEYFTHTEGRLSHLERYLFPAQLAVSITANVITAIAVGIQAWYYNATVRELRRTSSSPIMRMLLICAEAGAILSCIKIVNLVISITTFPRDSNGNEIARSRMIAGTVFNVFTDTVAAVYVALMITICPIFVSMFETMGPTLGTVDRTEGNIQDV
ncbi:hypothetical protein DL96DRAFT_1581861 [Flagelloscypha sp. PMI_526]|nr:hypothetical protein DL96DRAFT_1581861 [Flagelloscypha sp. PMI_526]